MVDRLERLRNPLIGLFAALLLTGLALAREAVSGGLPEEREGAVEGDLVAGLRAPCPVHQPVELQDAEELARPLGGQVGQDDHHLVGPEQHRLRQGQVVAMQEGGSSGSRHRTQQADGTPASR